MTTTFLYGALGALAFLTITLFILLLKTLIQRGRGGDLDSRFQVLSLQLEKMETMASQVDDLSRIFTLPRLRGAAGEVMLSQLLGNWLPKGSYAMQYRFNNGARADAVIKLGRFLVPVDSKFPLESLSSVLEGKEVGKQEKRVFLKHVEDIAAKYIRPEEGTMQFALMYIPSEKIYYRVFVEDEGSFTNEILSRGVLPVSPSNMFTYIQTAAYGLKGFSFTKEQKKMMDTFLRLKEEYTLLKRQYEIGTTHMKNLQKVWDETNMRLNRMESSLERMEEVGS